MPARSTDRPSASEADRAACRRLIRTGSRTFSAASLLLPAGLREAAYALYGFCRFSDDLVDVDGGAVDAIDRLRDRLDRAYAGRPADAAVDRAFADTVAAYGVPRALPEALIDGLEWDVDGVVCESLTDLHAYAARVAGSVGAMMSVLMGACDPSIVARACDLGVAMQLTNIARDVGEDARAGRLYLPRSWLRDEGLDPDAWLRRPLFCPAIGATVERVLQAADALYRRADSGISVLPASCRPGIFAARHLYREIGVEVARCGFDSVSRRAHVPGTRKLALMAHALLDAARPGRGPAAEPPLIETAYLVDAVSTAHPRLATFSERPLGLVSDRVIWVAQLFATLDARDRVPGEGA
jgi:phytoene synthase